MCRSSLWDDFACRWTGFNSPLRQFFSFIFSPFWLFCFYFLTISFTYWHVFLYSCILLALYGFARCCDKRISSLTLKRTNSLRVERLQRGINKKFSSISIQSNHSGNKSLINRCVIGCLPFTWANRSCSVHGLGKWYAKFRTVKFRPGFAFKHCTNQFH